MRIYIANTYIFDRNVIDASIGGYVSTTWGWMTKYLFAPAVRKEPDNKK
jgi:hypothetical protein